MFSGYNLAVVGGGEGTELSGRGRGGSVYNTYLKLFYVTFPFH